jgi:hypothetical protein
MPFGKLSLVELSRICVDPSVDALTKTILAL